MAVRVNVKYKHGIDSRGRVLADKIRSLIDEGFISPCRIDSIEVVDSYSSDSELDAERLYNKVTQELQDKLTADCTIEIGYKAGVTMIYTGQRSFRH